MADEDADREALGDAGHEPRECMACRGSGRVLSNLGGTAKSVECPWCEGSGTRIPAHDAQARRIADRESAEAETGGAGDSGDPADGTGPS